METAYQVIVLTEEAGKTSGSLILLSYYLRTGILQYLFPLIRGIRDRPPGRHEILPSDTLLYHILNFNLFLPSEYMVK